MPRTIANQEMGFGEPVLGQCIYPLPRQPLPVTASTSRPTPVPHDRCYDGREPLGMPCQPLPTASDVPPKGEHNTSHGVSLRVPSQYGRLVPISSRGRRDMAGAPGEPRVT